MSSVMIEGFVIRWILGVVGLIEFERIKGFLDTFGLNMKVFGE